MLADPYARYAAFAGVEADGLCRDAAKEFTADFVCGEEREDERLGGVRVGVVVHTR